MVLNVARQAQNTTNVAMFTLFVILSSQLVHLVKLNLTYSNQLNAKLIFVVGSSNNVKKWHKIWLQNPLGSLFYHVVLIEKHLCLNESQTSRCWSLCVIHRHIYVLTHSPDATIQALWINIIKIYTLKCIALRVRLLLVTRAHHTRTWRISSI